MKLIEKYWKEIRTGKTGFTEIDATFQANSYPNEGFYGKERKTLQAALNDARRHFNKTGEECEINVHWIQTDYYDDGTKIRAYEDAGLWGYQGATTTNMYNIDWL